MKRLVAIVPWVLLVAGCAAPATVAVGATPSPPASSRVTASPVSGSQVTASPVSGSSAPALSSPSPVPGPTNGSPAYAVLVDLTSSTSTYTLSLVDANGFLIQQVIDMRQRTPINTHNGTGIQLPYVSATSDSLYFLDGDSTLRVVQLGGQESVVSELDIPSGSAGSFAVSPDDSQIAVSVLDYTVFPVHLTLYTDSPRGGHKRVIFQSTTNFVWPVAWHAGLLVLAHAYGPFEEDTLKAAPARGNPYSALSYHLVDPTTAVRKVLMGACTVSGPLSPAGSGCIQGGSIDWLGNTTDWSTTDWGQRSSAAALSPDGQWMAATNPNDPTQMGIWRKADGLMANFVQGPGLHEWAGWIGNETILIGSQDPTWQPRVVNVLSSGPSPAHFVGARGFFAAIFPTNIV